jgi:AGZA family xanthine/uracil permease-like MFS transporter
MMIMFELKKHGTTAQKEVIAGFTTFFAMAYIMFVNPAMLSQTGMPYQAVFLATCLAAATGTLVMALFANVPYAQAPGMGLNAFFTYTVVFGLGFSWQEALGMVFLCGIVNIVITVTKLRKHIIRAIPPAMQNAIGGGIGIFVAYIGVKNAGLLSFTADPGTYAMLGDGNPATTTIVTGSGIVPALATFDTAAVIFAAAALLITAALVIKKVPGAILLGIFVSTVIGVLTGQVSLPAGLPGIGDSFTELASVFGAALTQGIPGLFGQSARLPLALVTIFAFSLTDTFDTIGTFIGTGRKTGIFDAKDEKALVQSKGFGSKMDRALFADAIATPVGALFGTSNTTTYVESAAGIGAGGRTGLTSLVTGLLFLASMILAPVIGIVPSQATAPSLIIVGVMMMSSFKQVRWDDLDEALPAFFAAIFMALCYSISYGIATGFIFFCLVKLLRGKAGEIHPILAVATVLFIFNFIILAVI